MSRLLRALRVIKYRLQAYRSQGRIELGRGIRFRGRLDIRGPGRVIIEDDVLIDTAPGDPLSFVTIYTLGPGAVVRIGSRARLYGARISCRHSIAVGPDALIEETGIADTDFHAVDSHRGPRLDESFERCRVVIHERVSLGARSIVAKGVEIGRDVVVCPGAVITRSLPPGAFAAGNPARVVDPYEREATRFASR